MKLLAAETSHRIPMHSLEDTIHDFLSLQSELLTALRNELGPRDWAYLTDVPSRGTITLADETWNYAKHGVGIQFQRNGVVVDANRQIRFDVDILDAGRLWEYAESLGRTELSWNGGVLGVEIGSLGRALEALCSAGLLEQCSEGAGRVYIGAPEFRSQARIP